MPLRFILKWLLISLTVGALAGTATMIFLHSLNWVTAFRETHLWIIAFLPLCGLVSGCFYHYIGKEVVGGHDLLVEEIHDPKNIVPLRMAPMVLLATLATHLFGGSAGREGTAVQMGGSIADQLTGVFRLKNSDRSTLLMAGMSAGFAAVFGTPLAGACFGIEVLAIGKFRYQAILPCLAAAVFGDYVARTLGTHHDIYSAGMAPAVSFPGLACALTAGAIFGLVGRLFAKANHGVGTFFKKTIAYPPLRPMIGGILVSAGVWLLGSTKYIGLGLSTMHESFTTNVRPWDFAGKFLFTILTLGSGFKGGEVTPLFFIGATLGNALSTTLIWLPAPTLAAMGFVGVFAGAANTPLTCTLMGMELFGPKVGVYIAVACVMSYLFSGRLGIYRSQRRR